MKWNEIPFDLQLFAEPETGGSLLNTTETFRAWPSGVTPSSRGVVALGRLSYLRNSMVLPPPTGMG